MSVSFDADFKSGLMFYFDPFISMDRGEGRRPFASLDFGPKDGGRIALRFFAVEDIAALASALFQLGRDFAEKIGPDDAVVPIGAEAGSTLSEDEINSRHDALRAAGLMEAAPITEPLIGGGVPRIEGEAE